jgi:hypothetical protein
MPLIADFGEVLPGPASDKLSAMVTRIQAGMRGQWNPVAYRVDRFTASAGSWLVKENLAPTRQMRLGSTMWLSFDLTETTVTDAPDYLQMALPDGLTLVASAKGPAVALDNGTPVMGVWRGVAGDTFLRFYADAALTPWSASTGATAVAASA